MPPQPLTRNTCPDKPGLSPLSEVRVSRTASRSWLFHTPRRQQERLGPPISKTQLPAHVAVLGCSLVRFVHSLVAAAVRASLCADTWDEEVVRRVRLCLVTLALLAWVIPVRADDELAKRHFAAGVAAGLAQRWEEAVVEFEASLREADRAGTRFNLVLANQKRDRPLELARHALMFLASSETDASKEAARERVTTLLREAQLRLTVLDRSALPEAATVLLDGQVLPSLDATHLLAPPGAHELEVRANDELVDSRRISLEQGQTVALPAPAQTSSSAPAPLVLPVIEGARGEGTDITHRANLPPDATESRATARRRYAAWTMGVAGAGLALGAAVSLGLAYGRADRISGRGASGTLMDGYLMQVDDYADTKATVMPMAFVSGAMLAGALAVGEHVGRRESATWPIASLVAGGALAGFGTFWLVREPEPLVRDTSLDGPMRELGSVLLSASLPLAAYGVIGLLRRRRGTVHAALGGVRASW